MAEYRFFGRVCLLAICCFFLTVSSENFTSEYSDPSSQNEGLSSGANSASAIGGSVGGGVVAVIGVILFICFKWFCGKRQVKENSICSHCCHLNHPKQEDNGNKLDPTSNKKPNVNQVEPENANSQLVGVTNTGRELVQHNANRIAQMAEIVAVCVERDATFTYIDQQVVYKDNEVTEKNHGVFKVAKPN